ncbi:MAG: methylated-DNA--[protein]-cysteine S-methyltransferase [Mycetocola sp.]
MTTFSTDETVIAELSATQAPAPELDAHLEALQRRLAVRAHGARLLDVSYRLLDSPVGSLLVAATDTGVVRVAYESEGFDAVLDALSERVSARVLRSPERLDTVAAQLEEYFAGSRRDFTVAVDDRLAAGFRQKVQRLLPAIPYGSTRSYADMAAAAGSPRAVRAVGTACATNPLPILVPCHRVLRSDGSVGGYVGGDAAKRSLLSLERSNA